MYQFWIKHFLFLPSSFLFRIFQMEHPVGHIYYFYNDELLLIFKGSLLVA